MIFFILAPYIYIYIYIYDELFLHKLELRLEGSMIISLNNNMTLGPKTKKRDFRLLSELKAYEI